MSNKNHHVVIAYFPSAEAASLAAADLKEWDKATDAVKLGGVGVLSWQDGKIKTRKVGARATGSGALWGTVLGATLGILSGGVSLIGGALVGVGAGALTGALFHKGLGLSDSDKARLEEHLQKGGAAVVAMADEDEVEPTKTELVKLGGSAEDYQVPAENLKHLQDALDVPPADEEEHAAEPAATSEPLAVAAAQPAPEEEPAEDKPAV